MTGKNSFTIEAPMFKRRLKQITDWEELEDKMRGKLSVSALSPDQKKVFDRIMRWARDAETGSLLTLGGYAGTGKSTITSIVARELEVDNPHIRIAFCAYTGKAANVLRQKLRSAGIHASILGHPHYAGTIHSLMYQPTIDKKTGQVLGWNRKNDLEEYDLIVIDEASMVDEEMLGDIRSYGIPILAVGDHGQLPPVKGQGALMLKPELRLEKIHRQAEDNPIIQLSKHIRETGELPEKWTDTENVRFCTFDEMFGILEPIYETTDVNDIAILTYTNRARQNFNYQARCMRNRQHMEREPQRGDQFMCLRNIRGTLFNGMRGILETDPKPHERHWYQGRFFFPDDELEVEGFIFDPQIGREKTFASFDEIQSACGRQFFAWGKLGMLFDYGYAMTVHKSQGSQFKHVFLVYERPRFSEADDFRRWLYTAVTRSSENLTIVVG